MPNNQTSRRNDERTRHLAYPLADTPAHAHDTDLPERVLVKPLCDEFARVFKHQVEARRSHVAVGHRRREVQQEDEMANDRAANRSGRCEESLQQKCKEFDSVSKRGECVREEN